MASKVKMYREKCLFAMRRAIEVFQNQILMCVCDKLAKDTTRTITFEWQSWCRLLLCKTGGGLMRLAHLCQCNANPILYNHIQIQIIRNIYRRWVVVVVSVCSVCSWMLYMKEDGNYRQFLKLFAGIRFLHHIHCEMTSRQCQNYKIWSQSRSVVVIYSCRNINVPDFNVKMQSKIGLWVRIHTQTHSRTHKKVFCALFIFPGCFLLPFISTCVWLLLQYTNFLYLSTRTFKRFECYGYTLSTHTFTLYVARRWYRFHLLLLWKSIHIPLIHLLVTESTFTTSATFMHF